MFEDRADVAEADEDGEGEIRRVKRCKRVVVELEGIASVAIAFVPVGTAKGNLK